MSYNAYYNDFVKIAVFGHLRQNTLYI